MAINVATSFNVQTNLPIDERLVLSKEQMLNINDNTMPETYMATCTDDGQLYIYKKDNDKDAKTGRFRLFETGGGAVVEVDGESDLPNPPELNVYVTAHKDITTTDMSSLWYHDMTNSRFQISFSLSRNEHFIMRMSDGSIIDLDYTSPSSDWIKRPDPYKDTFYYGYDGSTENLKTATLPCANVQANSSKNENGTNITVYNIIIYAKQPYSFEIESIYQPTYRYSVPANGSTVINPLCTKAVEKGVEYSLDEDFTLPYFKYDAATRTIKNLISTNALGFHTIIGAAEHQTEDREMRVWARDIELATKEYVDEHGGGGSSVDNQLILNNLNEWYALSVEERKKYLNCEIIVIDSGIFVYKTNPYDEYVLEPIATQNDFPNGLYTSQISAYKGEDDDFTRSHIYLTDQVEIHTGKDEEDVNESTLTVQDDNTVLELSRLMATLKDPSKMPLIDSIMSSSGQVSAKDIQATIDQEYDIIQDYLSKRKVEIQVEYTGIGGDDLINVNFS